MRPHHEHPITDARVSRPTARHRHGDPESLAQARPGAGLPQDRPGGAVSVRGSGGVHRGGPCRTPDHRPQAGTAAERVTLDLTFHVTVPIPCAFTVEELVGLLRGDIDETPLCSKKKAEALSNAVDDELSKAWFDNSARMKFQGVDIDLVGIDAADPADDEDPDSSDDERGWEVPRG
jgi:hypothetical protein